jgi:hypothetical protein
MWGTSVIKKTAHGKQLPNGRKFAQSVHPASIKPTLMGAISIQPTQLIDISM